MDEAGEIKETMAKQRRGPGRLGKAALAFLLLLALTLAILWPLRFDLARHYVDAELASRGVRASYEIEQIGLNSVAFDHVVIGDPRQPDLVADHVELGLALRFTGLGIGAISARGVRMNGRLAEGRLSLGALDALTDRAPDAPFRLPDRNLELDDAALRLATPAGDLILALSGRGNLAGEFRGGLVLLSPELRLGPCLVQGVAARLSLRVQDGRPRLHGPATTATAACGSVTAVRPLLALSALLPPGLDQWRGSLAGRTPALRTGGEGFAPAGAHLTFEGDAARTVGNLDIGLGAMAIGPLRAARTSFAGRYAATARQGLTSLDGRLTLSGLARAGTAAGGPIGALATVLRFAAGAEASADMALARRPDGSGFVRFRPHGLVLRAAGGTAVTWPWPAGEER